MRFNLITNYVRQKTLNIGKTPASVHVCTLPQNKGHELKGYSNQEVVPYLL